MSSGSVSSRSLFQRHRGKVLTSVGIVATLFTAGSVCMYLVKRWLYKQQLKITEQHFIREQIRRRFTQTQEDSLYALYELIPVFAMVLAKKLDLEELVIALRDKKLSKTGSQKARIGDNDVLSSGISTSVTEVDTSTANVANKSEGKTQKTKAELWNELKTKSLIKMVTISYTISALLLLTRLQLNILTRREYLETAIRVAVEKESSLSDGKSVVSWIWGLWKGDDTKSAVSEAIEDSKAKPTPVSKNSYINEQAFLSLSWWLLNRGWQDFEAIVEENVEKQFGQLNPRDTLSITEFSEKLTEVFRDTNKQLFPDATNEQNGTGRLQTILLPRPDLEDFVLKQTLDPEAFNILNEDKTVFGQLILETAKCLESTVSSIVLETLVNESFQYIMEQVETNVSKKKNKQKTAKESDCVEDSDAKYQMAVFTISCKDCCNEILKSGVVSMDNEFLARLDSVVILDDLSASVYSNFGFQD
ncbi:hypothetical protein HG536_0E02680 [Torulaspora globosa]|uniref:Peroxin-3 n=1 Tax=Torulaspora globosa TaxID=48254 RepID=A0A7G3ZIM1_9SACH|nr:uncharacterized protein HG536_0E02680 [Torulaspora globosa]QLL33357.1 hypothetical protein HG536_0E02680 [Torulaspora globosa]